MRQTETSSDQRLHRVTRVLALIGSTVVIGVVLLVLLEVGTRLFVGAPAVTDHVTIENAAYAYHPWSGHRATPGFAYKAMSINSWGWRGPEPSEAKPSGVRRVLLLGDSVAFSSYHIRDSVTIAGYLERFLREKTGGSWNVINMAVPSGTSHVSVATLAHEGLRFAPDVVVALNGSNDIRWMNPALPDGPQFPRVFWPQIQVRMAQLYDPRTGRGRVGPNLAMLLAESAFYRRLIGPEPRQGSPAWPDRMINVERLDDFVRNTEVLHALAQGAGATFVHVLQPYLSLRHNTIGAREEALIREYEASARKGRLEFMDRVFPVLAERLRAAARARGFRAVDLSHFFTEADVFGDHVHFIERDANESVFNRRLALRMAEEIAAEVK